MYVKIYESRRDPSSAAINNLVAGQYGGLGCHFGYTVAAYDDIGLETLAAAEYAATLQYDSACCIHRRMYTKKATNKAACISMTINNIDYLSEADVEKGKTIPLMVIRTCEVMFGIYVYTAFH